MLSADDILKPDELPVEKVTVPEWGGDVYVATLRADDRDAMEERLGEMKSASGLAGFRAQVVATCLCKENGERLFVYELAQAAEALGKKSAKVVDRIYTVASRINGISKEDEDDLTKN
jgi:hypothetical protein